MELPKLKAEQKLIDISKVLPNPTNPRSISETKFKDLKRSIKKFPKMLHLRPLVLNDNMEVLGGNMRLKALQELGFKKVPIIMADELTEEEQEQFIIKDNIAFGAWDWDQLANDWNNEALQDWGLDVWNAEDEPDYSILDDDAAEEQVENMADGVKTAIQIEFLKEDYDAAFEIIKSHREKGHYVGGMIMKALK